VTPPTKRSRSRSRHLDEPTTVAHTDADVVDLDATVQRVGTFAAGQSAEGRYLDVAAAPKGDFAVGQTEEDEPTSREDPPRPRPVRAH